MIEVHGLVKVFGLKPILRGLDLRLDEGEFVALLGPNGAGKTTLLRILASLSRPTAGEVKVGGHPLPARARPAPPIPPVVPPQPLLSGALSAEENLKFYGGMYGAPRLDQRIAQVLKTVGLWPRRRDLVREFSRGMQQRLSIGRA